MRFALSIASLAAVFILLFAAGCTQGPQTQGRAVFAIADAAADMGNVTSVMVTVDSVQVQREGEGWTTVTSTSHTYDLLQLKASGNQSLLADVNLTNGTYGQVRLSISKVLVTDSSGVHEAKLPSGELKIVGGFNVTSNSTVLLTFDFLADQSLHVTGNSKYILAPVVHMQERVDAEINTSRSENVEIREGRIKTDITVGMDENGDVGKGNRIARDQNLTIRADGKIMKETKSNAGGNGGNADSNAGGNKDNENSNAGGNGNNNKKN